LIQRIIPRLILTALIVLATLTLTACGQAPPSGWPGLTPGEGVVYLTATTKVYAVNTTDGTQKWPYEAKIQQAGLFGNQTVAAKLNAPPAVEEGVVYFGSDEGILLAVDAATGTQKWEFTPEIPTIIPILNIKEKAGAIFAGPVLAGKRVIVGTQNKVYALDTTTHKKPDWEFEAGSQVWGTPLVVGDTVYVSTLGHKLVALNAETGKVRWVLDKPKGALAGSPVHDNGVIYVGSFDNHLYAVDAATGEQVWPEPFDANNWIWEGPAVVSGTLYFGDMSGNVRALDAATQKLVWSEPFQAGGPVRATPLYADGTLYVGTASGVLYALDAATGQPRWSQPFQVQNAQFLTTPLMRDGVLLVAPLSAPTLLYGLDPSNGQAKWQFNPAGK